MTRKHYVALAAVIAGEVATATDQRQVRTSSNIARSIADVAMQDNPFFDRVKFYLACGLDNTGGPKD
jgi:hypothetical protein